MFSKNSFSILKFLATGVLFFFYCTININGQERYKIVLYVYSQPSINAPVLGTLNPNEQIDVYGISGQWAEIRYKNQPAYVTVKYLQKIEKETKPETKIETDTTTVIEIEEKPDTLSTLQKDKRIKEKIKYSFRKYTQDIGIDFIPAIYGGYSNFIVKEVSPKPTMGWGLDFAFQFLAKNKIWFIPKDYFMEASLGYTMRGSKAYKAHYLDLKLSPFGYKYQLNEELNLLGKIGLYFGFPLGSDISTEKNYFDCKTDVGILIGIGAEYRNIGFGLSFEQGFTKAYKAQLKLHNQGIFINISYRLFNLK